MEREELRKFYKNYVLAFANSLLLVPELLLSGSQPIQHAHGGVGF